MSLQTKQMDQLKNGHIKSANINEAYTHIYAQNDSCVCKIIKHFQSNEGASRLAIIPFFGQALEVETEHHILSKLLFVCLFV